MISCMVWRALKLVRYRLWFRAELNIDQEDYKTIEGNTIFPEEKGQPHHLHNPNLGKEYVPAKSTVRGSVA